MIPSSTASNPKHRNGYVPMPWHAAYEFGRPICAGCAATFGPRPHGPLSQPRTANDDGLQFRLVLISNGAETSPVTRGLPAMAFDPGALAVRIADAIAASVGVRTN